MKKIIIPEHASGTNPFLMIFEALLKKMPSKSEILDRLVPLKGRFELQIIDAKTGRVIENYVDKNLVVNGGRTAVMVLLGSSASAKQLTKLSVGTNGTAPVGTDTTITGAFTKNVGATSYPTANSVRFDWQLGAGDANGINIAEFGLLCTDNTLFARKVRAVIAKNSDIILNGNWTISF